MSTDLLDLKGVGEKGLIKLNKIGIRTVEDLLFHWMDQLEIFLSKKRQ